MSVIAPVSSAVYYQGQYWNDFEEVRRLINVRISGDPDREWYQHFTAQSGGRRFKRALILNCGNGWVESSHKRVTPPTASRRGPSHRLHRPRATAHL